MHHEQSGVWDAKLAAWLHDPAEKALILLRARGGHEEGSSVARLRELFFSKGLEERLVRIARLADHWASAADRPTLPKPGDPELRRAFNVRFWGREGAVLKHPLDGREFRLPDMYGDSVRNIEKASFAGLLPLVERREEIDPRTAFLRLWRLGPESDPPGLDLGALWRMLPADTRIPDHSIWEHLSLTSAFAGAMAGDPEGNPALLAVSLGPVQSFIAQARSTSDLWAGSHLLAAMSWEAMKVICEELGPDAVIFPNLWGVPRVDVWLEEQGVALPKGEGAPAWKRSASDANPLFTAALPNRFVALVPASEAADVANEIEEAVRAWMVDKASEAAKQILEKAGSARDEDCDLWQQIHRQLEDFPEVYWAAVPFAPLVEWSEEPARKGVKTTIQNVEALRSVLARFYPDGNRGPGFLGSEQWRLLQNAIEGDGIVYVPNPGVLYPALYDLLDRVMAAAKTARSFSQSSEEGYRCTLCGEREWLRGPGDGQAGMLPPGSRDGTLWTRLAKGKPSWARKGEHLCARCALKRLWPELLAAGKVSHAGSESLGRYVVSTHTMALARDLLELAGRMKAGELRDLGALREAVRPHAAGQRAALPRKVYRALRDVPDIWPLAAQIPVALDEVRESEDTNAGRVLNGKIESCLGHQPEAYYAVLLFDGDRMGAWISGTEPDLTLPFEATWHPSVTAALTSRGRVDGRLADYLKMKRPASPARHAAISSALNGFSLHVVPWVVEEVFAGKVIYAGGDDVLAMLPVDDVLPCLLVLRCAYAGLVPAGDEDTIAALLGEANESPGRIGGGYVLLGGKNGRLLRMMGHKATASAGVVVAHHQTPLQAVIREARAAERRAKNEGGRNAFSISLMKRSGGTTRFTAGFGFGGSRATPEEWKVKTAKTTPLGALFALRDTLATENVSRRAAYNILAWLPDIPPSPGGVLNGEAYTEMLRRNVAWQLRRQGVGRGADPPTDHAERLAEALMAAAVAEAERRKTEGRFTYTGYLEGMLTVAEFLAREGRKISRENTGRPAESKDAGEGGAS